MTEIEAVGDLRNIAKAYLATAGAGDDDHVVKFVQRVAFIRKADQHVLIPGLNAAGWQIEALALNGAGDVGNAYAVLPNYRF